MNIEELNLSISELTGVGPKAKESYRALGVETISDLVQLSPKGYEDRRHRVCIGQENSSLMTNTVVCVQTKSRFGKGLKSIKALVKDTQSGVRAELLGFNRSYLDHVIHEGSYYHLFGKVMPSNGYGRPQYSAFEINPIPEGFLSNLDFVLDGGLLPVYPLSAGLTENSLRRDVKNALARIKKIPEILPEKIITKYKLIDFDSAIRKLHFPTSENDILNAKRTLAFAEVFYLQLLSVRHPSQSTRRAVEKKTYYVETSFIENLGFKLTSDQIKVLDEIRTDMSSETAMNRLLQGDVGSGKTLVAWVSALHSIAEGHQVAFMAPTELLARQHAANAAKLFEKSGITVAYLDGEVKGSARTTLLKQLKAGNINLIIGTHALFSKDVEYNNLGFVIIDEQHRFGVEQRASLLRKGQDPDVLLMTATPIPRTLALTLYGNLSVSTIKTMPVGRLPVKTYLVSSARREDMYKAVEVELRRGHQAYFVYPRIEAEEDDNSSLKDVTSMFEQLSSRYKDYAGALIHSRLKDDDKIRILNEFSEGKIRFLVATSVVEVGLDVANATCMVVEDSENFGLSALHQLRGRVGRSTLQSWCFLVYGDNLSDDGKKRLKALYSTNDGFVIAEEDLKIRGPGEISGLRQSGFTNLKYASLDKDIEMFAKAREEVQNILSEDPGLLSLDNSVIRSQL